MEVRDLMSYPLCIVKPDDSVKDVIDAMTAEKKGIAIIAKDGILSKCEGFATKGEIFIRVFVKGLNPENVKQSGRSIYMHSLCQNQEKFPKELGKNPGVR